jgi:cytochrome c biogenesis protein CcdA
VLDEEAARRTAAAVSGGGLASLVVVALTVGLADSLTPETIGPALYLATAKRPVRSVLEFTVGVFVVQFVVGLALTSGLGRWLLSLVPNPQGTARHVIEFVAGVLLLVCAVVLWLGRKRLAGRELPMVSGGGSAFVTGASITAVGMPTAAPYLAVVAGIVASGSSIPAQISLILLYNLAFVAPLIGVLAILLFAGERAGPLLTSAGSWLQREWPAVLAGLLLVIGSILLLLGAAGLIREG